MKIIQGLKGSNNNELQPIAVCAFSDLYPGEQEWEAFATVLLSPLHNPPGTMMMQKFDLSCQHDISATRKLSEKVDQAGVTSTNNTVEG